MFDRLREINVKSIIIIMQLRLDRFLGVVAAGHRLDVGPGRVGCRHGNLRTHQTREKTVWISADNKKTIFGHSWSAKDVRSLELNRREKDYFASFPIRLIPCFYL